MKKHLLFSLLLLLGFQLSAQMCDVVNGQFQAWDTVRQEHPWQTDSLDFYWPNRWQPFIWNGVDDFIEPLVPGAEGMGDTAVAMYSTGLDASLTHYLACEDNPTVLNGAYYHEGMPDDTLTISVLGVRADTSGGNSNLDTLAVAVIFDLIPYEEIILLDTQLIGGSQSFTNFSLPLPYLTNDTSPNLIIIISVFNRGPGSTTEKRLYALDNLELLSNSTALDESFAAVNSALKIYPNPAHSQMVVSPPFQESFNLRLINPQGQTVQRHPNLVGDIELDLTALPKGVYVLLLENDEHLLLASKKFVKQ
ncbi:MAG: T9SS type A sorting domain-containing protein [Bacteroidota bacterium]